MTHTWICADGTGTLDATYEVRLDSSEDWSGQLEAGTWRISGGIDAYSGFTGSGYAVVNFDARDNAGVATSGVRGMGGWVFSGEITTG